MIQAQFGASMLSWIRPVWNADAGLFAIQQASAAGFDLLEILLPVSMDIDTNTVKKQLKRHRLEAACGFHLPRFAHIPSFPGKAIRLIKAALEKTAELEATYLGGVLHGGIGVFSRQARTPEEEDTLCLVWQKAADHARQYGITIGIEPVNRYESYVCTGAAETLELIGRVGASNLVLQLDTFHMNIEEANFYDPVIAAGSRLRHVHITESNRGLPGEGNVRWDDFFQALSDINFIGNLVLENFSTSVTGMDGAVSLWRPSKYPADELATKSLNFMRSKAAKFNIKQ